ncbi:MAG: hypothetical protein COW48_08690 [Hydrogenophilales bacterium CG17_big_fil_post_rev_8_21_14_2_50_63_12]|nr:MAG: hypothetical protein COW48_08690 [Hydrogenophilales bacterium CG17_big_fil_post_rev_8_21_14_2_50_63_12]
MVRRITAGLALLMLVGCGTVGTCEDGSGGIRLFGDSVAKRYLAKGVSEYQAGNYLNARIAFDGVLQNRYATRGERISANKYMAFIHCASGETGQCAEYFKQLLALDPFFELSKAEAGHPLWGPVFRGEKKKVTGNTVKPFQF